MFSQVGKEIKLDTIGCQFESYLTAGCIYMLAVLLCPCGLAWPGNAAPELLWLLMIKICTKIHFFSASI